MKENTMPFTVEREPDLKEHADAENITVDTESASLTCKRKKVVHQGTIISQSVTTTKKCLIVIVTHFISTTASKLTDIQRDSVNKTKETTVGKATITDCFVQLQYATEVLDAGSYTYKLVNTSGKDMHSYGECIKIVAVEA